MTNIKKQKLISSTQVLGYNTQFLLYSLLKVSKILNVLNEFVVRRFTKRLPGLKS